MYKSYSTKKLVALPSGTTKYYVLMFRNSEIVIFKALLDFLEWDSQAKKALFSKLFQGSPKTNIIKEGEKGERGKEKYFI